MAGKYYGTTRPTIDGVRASDCGARWLSPAQLDAWLDLAALMIRLPVALESQLQRDAELSQFEYFVLAHLSESPGREVRMSELAAMSNGSLSRLSHVVARLERKGWVLRRPSAEDGRSTMAWLTDEGVEKIVASAPGHVERVRDLVVDALTPEQLEALGEACRQVLDRIDSRDGGAVPPRPHRRSAN